MPIVLKRKVVRTDNSLRVTLPTEILELLKVAESESSFMQMVTWLFGRAKSNEALLGAGDR